MAPQKQKEPTVADLWELIQGQRAEIEALQGRHRGSILRRISRGRGAVVVTSVILSFALMTSTPFTWIAGASQSFWGLGGNSGTNPSTNFLGTTDGQPLVIKTNNAEAMRIDTGQNVGIGTTTPAYKLDVTGDVNASGNLREAGATLGSKYAYVGGSNSSGTWPIGITGNAAGFTGNLSGDVTGTQGATRLADGSVTTAKFAAGATAPNAAALNGIGANGFLQGTGHYAVASGTATGGQALLFYNSNLAGFYFVVGDCNDTNTPNMRMSLGSDAFQSAQVWTEVAGSTPTYTTFQFGAGGEFALAAAVPTDGGVQRVTWHVLQASGPITITAWDHSSNGTCTFSAEATVGF